MNNFTPEEAKKLLSWSEELLVAIRINKEPTIRAVLAKAKKMNCVQEICAATIATREEWLVAVRDFPEYPLLLKIGREKRVPVIEAIKNSRDAMVRLMLDAGLDVNARPIRTLRTALEACVTYNRLDMMAMLIEEYHADPNHKDPLWQTPVFHALKVRNIEAMDYLFSQGANPNAVDSFGDTPLLFFLQDKDLRTLDREILEHLLNSGADCNLSSDRSKRAALHVILSNNSVPADIKVMVVEMLLERRADADIIDSKTRSPLHSVCDVNECSLDPGSRCKLIKLLIQFSADPDIQDSEYKTALHIAAENCLPKVVETLAENKANPKLRDVNGKRPSDLVSKESQIGSIIAEAIEKWEKEADAISTKSNEVGSDKMNLGQTSDSSSNLVRFKDVSPQFQAKNKRFRTSINRLEDAISVLDGELKTSQFKIFNTQEIGSQGSGLDEVDGTMPAHVTPPVSIDTLHESLKQIQAEFFKLKSYAYSFEKDYQSLLKELKLHGNCKASLDISGLDEQDFGAGCVFGETAKFRPESPQRPTSERVLLSKAVNKVSAMVGHDWRMLLRTLESSEDCIEVDTIIKEIEDKHRGLLREQAYQSLLYWMKRYGPEASLDNLLQALSDCDLIEIKDRLESLRDEN